MQDRCRQLILLTSPLLLWAACVCYPVVDDWTYLTVPNFDGFMKADYLLPRGNQWRPFDAIFGYLLALRPTLFPWMNHVVIVVGHVVNTLLVYSIGQQLGFKSLARYISTLVFYLSPAMVATVLNTDSINQVYSQLWGLTGLLICLRMHGRRKYVLWGITLLLATLSKENGIMWAWVTPLVVAGGKNERRAIRNGFLWGTFVAFLYLTVRFAWSTEVIRTDSAYVNDGLLQHVRGLMMLIGYTFIPLDYVSIVHAPSRNGWLIAITLLLSIPFLMIFVRYLLKSSSRIGWVLLAGILLLALPHLLTIFSVLHAYAALSLSALLIGFVTQQETRRQWLIGSFIAYAAAMLISTGHHWQKSVESGETARQLVREVLRQSKHSAHNVFLIMQEDKSPQYSSFCVNPADAFGWGRAVCMETHYQWPESITELVVPVDQWNEKKDSFIFDALSMGYDAVWIQKHHTITVLEKESSHSTLP